MLHTQMKIMWSCVSERLNVADIVQLKLLIPVSDFWSADGSHVGSELLVSFRKLLQHQETWHVLFLDAAVIFTCFIVFSVLRFVLFSSTSRSLLLLRWPNFSARINTVSFPENQWKWKQRSHRGNEDRVGAPAALCRLNKMFSVSLHRHRVKRLRTRLYSEKRTILTQEKSNQWWREGWNPPLVFLGSPPPAQRLLVMAAG